MKHLNEENFETELDGKIAIIDFFADWCMPCRMLAPIYEKLSEKYKGKLEFYKINTEEAPELAERFSVQGIPCMIIVNDKEEVNRIVGFNPEDILKDKIDKILKEI